MRNKMTKKIIHKITPAIDISTFTSFHVMDAVAIAIRSLTQTSGIVQNVVVSLPVFKAMVLQIEGMTPSMFRRVMTSHELKYIVKHMQLIITATAKKDDGTSSTIKLIIQPKECKNFLDANNAKRFDDLSDTENQFAFVSAYMPQLFDNRE